MKKSEKIAVVFCLIFFLTNLISFSQQTKIFKEVIPAPPHQGVIICDDPLIDKIPPLSPLWQSRHSRKYTGMVAGNFDKDSIHEVAFDFGSLGIWIYDPNDAAAWKWISYDDPEWMITINPNTSSGDELFVEWASGSIPQNSWWHGSWTVVSNTEKLNYAYDAGDVNGDGDHEVIIQWDGYGIYVCNYTGSEFWGGFNLYRISTTEAEGFPIQFAAADYELLHAFSDGTKFWNYSLGYPSTNWTTINSASLDISNSIAADIDGGIINNELMADILDQLWLYDHDTATWTRLNFNKASGIYPVAYDLLGEQYEFLMKFSGVAGLWAYDPDITTAGIRSSWNQPEYVLGADYRTSADGGNNGEEVIADFGPLGVWIQLTWNGGWTRINWNNPEAMIQADLDSDPEMEIVFDFGPTGVWVWDGAGSGTGSWTRINYRDPESTAPLGDGYDR